MRNFFHVAIACLFTFSQAIYANTPATGMVVSESIVASQVGADILKAGGNAIDAAVAVGYALAVVKPCCGNLGGGGFMTIHLANGKNIFINFREKAPLAASKDMFLDQQGRVAEGKTTFGYLAVGVPGTVMGLEHALIKYGTMTRQQVMASAISIAEKGYEVTPYDFLQFKNFVSDFRKQANVADIFLKNGEVYRPGEYLVQADLAETLKHISQSGSKYFYHGPIAKKIVAASNANGGILSLQDFEGYSVEEIDPIICHYRGYEVISAPPPSSGGVTLCEMLNILENFPLKRWGRNSLETTRVIIEAMRYAYLDRNTKLADPDFITNPINHLISKQYAKRISERIKSYDRAPKSIAPDYHAEITDTTHYSIIDSQGNAVSVTYTINGFFGALVIADKTGFFLNNEMDDFSSHPGVANKFGLVQSSSNAIAPGKRPLSSMTPTILMKDGEVVMVIGSPGGSRIITSLLLSIINVIDFNMSINEAVNTPRFHYQANPDVVDVEPFSVSFFLRHQLELLGYHVLPQKTWGAVETIYVKSSGTLEGANDSRRPDGGIASAPISKQVQS